MAPDLTGLIKEYITIKDYLRGIDEARRQSLELVDQMLNTIAWLESTGVIELPQTIKCSIDGEDDRYVTVEKTPISRQVKLTISYKAPS